MRKFKRLYKQFAKEDKIGFSMIVVAIICGIINTVIRFIQSRNYEQLYDNIIMLFICIIMAIVFIINAITYVSKSGNGSNKKE